LLCLPGHHKPVCRPILTHVTSRSERKLPLLSGPTNPCTINVDTETCSRNSPQNRPWRVQRERNGGFSPPTTLPPVGQLSIEHMLLQPRSAPETTLDFGFVFLFFGKSQSVGASFRAPLHVVRSFCSALRSTVCHQRPRAWAPSIFGAVHFDRWVVTHSIAGSNLHGHRPILQSKRRPSEVLWMSEQPVGLLRHHFRFSPHRQYCLPVVAHLGPRRVVSFVEDFFLCRPHTRSAPESFVANSQLSRRRIREMIRLPSPDIGSGASDPTTKRQKGTIRSTHHPPQRRGARQRTAPLLSFAVFFLFVCSGRAFAHRRREGERRGPRKDSFSASSSLFGVSEGGDDPSKQHTEGTFCCTFVVRR